MNALSVRALCKSFGGLLVTGHPRDRQVHAQEGAGVGAPDRPVAGHHRRQRGQGHAEQLGELGGPGAGAQVEQQGA